MNRQVLVAGVAVVALACGLSACGGSDKKATPKPTATTATTPAVPVQPKGANGVTYELEDYSTYAKDPAVRAWIETNEAVGASTNSGKVLPAMRQGMNKAVLRQYSDSVQFAWKKHLHVLDISRVRVLSSQTTGTNAHLTTCIWGPSAGLYDTAGKYFGDSEEFWFKSEVDLKSESGQWVITKADFNGKCPGGAPE